MMRLFGLVCALGLALPGTQAAAQADPDCRKEIGAFMSDNASDGDPRLALIMCLADGMEKIGAAAEDGFPDFQSWAMEESDEDDRVVVISAEKRTSGAAMVPFGFIIGTAKEGTEDETSYGQKPPEADGEKKQKEQPQEFCAQVGDETEEPESAGFLGGLFSSFLGGEDSPATAPAGGVRTGPGRTRGGRWHFVCTSPDGCDDMWGMGPFYDGLDFNLDGQNGGDWVLKMPEANIGDNDPCGNVGSGTTYPFVDFDLDGWPPAVEGPLIVDHDSVDGSFNVIENWAINRSTLMNDGNAMGCPCAATGAGDVPANVFDGLTDIKR